MRVNPALVVGTILFAASPAFAKAEAATAVPEAASVKRESGVHSRPVAQRVGASSDERAVVNARQPGDRSGRAANADALRYAEREAQSGAVQDYRGGDTVVIGATTATIVLAVILLIVLL